MNFPYDKASVRFDHDPEEEYKALAEGRTYSTKLALYPLMDVLSRERSCHRDDDQLLDPGGPRRCLEAGSSSSYAG